MLERRSKLAVLGLGAIGLAGALTLAALAAPDRIASPAPVFTPATPTTVVATVPRRDPAEVTARLALAAAPDRVELATDPDNSAYASLF